MSYAAGLHTTSYPSTLLSDGYVQRSSFDNMYPPTMSYTNDNNNRLLRDDIAYKPIPSMQYGPSQSNGYHPNPPGNAWPSSHQVPDQLMSMNDITEYSESMGTASNTNTASSVARTIEDQQLYGTMKKPTKYPPNPMWNQKQMPVNTTTTTTTNTKKPLFDEPKRAPQYRAAPKPTKKAPPHHPVDHSKDDLTPVPASQARLTTMHDMDQPTHSRNIEAWLNDSKKDLNSDDFTAEQVWSDKINQLHMVQAQREKDKIKSSRALPNDTKKFEGKSNVNPSRQTMGNKSQEKQPGPYSHFDTLFDGDYYHPTNYSSHPNYPPQPKPKPKRPKPLTNFPPEEYSAKPMKYIPPSRTSRYEPPISRYDPPTSRYEPPTSKRPPPAITTSSWRSHWPRHYMYDAAYPYYLHPEFMHHEYIHKDEEERYREALQILRAERAEQQQKQISETTAKRLTYGDYVRTSTKEGSLQTTVKPSPWSDFMDLKKGNVYDISREEKKQLYHQSKSYGERVRHRNVGFYEGDPAQSHRSSMPFLDDIEETPSSNLTPRQTKPDGTSKSVSRTSKHRPDSASMKRTNLQRMASNPTSRSNHYHRSDDDQGFQSDTGVSQRSKRSTTKKNVHYGKNDSSQRTNSATEDSDTEVENRSVRSRIRPKKENLSTVREERTLEAMEVPRYKKPVEKQKK